ncbi:MAG: outer membrane beta-barrel protein [Bacteroidales bacterium]|nr:outer membrane beta-barrel protein [Bacteroidales bacterium]
MKKVFAFVAVAAALLVAGKANAQIGVNAGYASQSYINNYNNGNHTDTTSMTGFFIGANYNLNLTGDLNLSVGLQARYNTASDSIQASLFGFAGSKVKTTQTQILLDVPVLFNYGFNLTNDLKASVFLGPTFSFAVKGNTNVQGSANVLGTSLGSGGKDYNWYASTDDGGYNYNALDISGTIGLCLDFTGIRLYGGYNMGLLNLHNSDNWTRKGSNIFVGVGYAL